MKKFSFLAGMLTAALIGGLGVTALAASGAVSFNASPIQFNGKEISAKGEDYALANGCAAPSSITYTDELGGGTTYLPVRRIAELMGVEIGYDGTTGSVTVTGESKTATPETPPVDYSDWSAEDEAAYQEFKGLWEVESKGVDTSLGQNRDSYHFSPNHSNADAIEKLELIPYETRDKYAERLLREYKKDIGVIIAFMDTSGSWSGYGISIYESGELWLGHK